MADIKQVKYDYATKVLNQALLKEEESLKMWCSIAENPNSDAIAMRQAKGNLPSNTHRVEELKKAIEMLNPSKILISSESPNDKF